MTEKTNFEKYIDKRIKKFGELKEQNKDWGTLILGLRRMGKSTLAQYIAYKIWEAYNKEPDVYIVFGSLKDSLEYLKHIKNSIVIFDELGVTAFSRDFMKEEQKELIKSLYIMSVNNNYYIGVIQDLTMLDKQLRNVNFWKDLFVVYYRDIKENKGKSLYFGTAQKLIDNGSIQYIFNEWDFFSKAYYSLAPWTVNQLFVDFNLNPIHITYYIENIFWDSKFLKIVGKNEIISPNEYKDIYRKNFDLYLTVNDKKREIMKQAYEFYENYFNRRGTYTIIFYEKYRLTDLSYASTLEIIKTPEGISKDQIELMKKEINDLSYLGFKKYLKYLKNSNLLDYRIISNKYSEKKEKIQINKNIFIIKVF